MCSDRYPVAGRADFEPARVYEQALMPIRRVSARRY